MSHRETPPPEVPTESPPKVAQEKADSPPKVAQEKAAEPPAATGTLSLAPLALQETEFPGFLKDYLAKVDYPQRSSFGDAEACISQMKGGYEQHYLKFTSKGATDGLLCVNIDHSH